MNDRTRPGRVPSLIDDLNATADRAEGAVGRLQEARREEPAHQRPRPTVGRVLE